MHCCNKISSNVSLGGKEQGFEPCDEDLFKIDRQQNLDGLLLSPIPLQGKWICNKSCQEHCVELDNSNV